MSKQDNDMVPRLAFEARVASLEKTLRVLRGLIGRLNSRADFMEGRL